MLEIDPPSFAVPSPEELTPLFHGYEIQRIIGYGGMGVVYKGIDKHFKRDIAIKVLLSKTYGEEEFFRQFFAEAQSMSMLEHKYLVKIYDYGEINGMLFIVMDYVHGCCLRDAILPGGMSPRKTSGIMMRVCEGLAHAHGSDILHRDLKPDNILLDQYNSPKIADFGLSRDFKDTSKEKVIWGSPGFMAPEVIYGSAIVDHRADIYALGCVLYNMITGILPDPDNLDFSAFDKQDPRFSYILSRSMTSDINFRYDSAAEMAEAFRDLILSLDEQDSEEIQTNYYDDPDYFI